MTLKYDVSFDDLEPEGPSVASPSMSEPKSSFLDVSFDDLTTEPVEQTQPEPIATEPAETRRQGKPWDIVVRGVGGAVDRAKAGVAGLSAAMAYMGDREMDLYDPAGSDHARAIKMVNEFKTAPDDEDTRFAISSMGVNPDDLLTGDTKTQFQARVQLTSKLRTVRLANDQYLQGILAKGKAATDRYASTAVDYGDDGLGKSMQFAEDILAGSVDMIPAIIASYVASPVAGAGMMGGSAMGHATLEGVNELGLDPDKAMLRSTVFAAAEFLPEIKALQIFTEGGKNKLTKILKAAGAEGLQEGFTEAIQSGYDWATGIDPNMTLGEYMETIGYSAAVGAGVGATLRTPIALLEGNEQPAQPGSLSSPPAIPAPAGRVEPQLDPEVTFDDLMAGTPESEAPVATGLRTVQPGESIEVEPQPLPADPNGLQAFGKGAGQAINDNLKTRLWDEYEGRAQAIDPMVKRARAEKPGMSQDELLSWIQSNPPATTAPEVEAKTPDKSAILTPNDGMLISGASNEAAKINLDQPPVAPVAPVADPEADNPAARVLAKTRAEIARLEAEDGKPLPRPEDAARSLAAARGQEYVPEPPEQNAALRVLAKIRAEKENFDREDVQQFAKTAENLAAVRKFAVDQFGEEKAAAMEVDIKAAWNAKQQDKRRKIGPDDSLSVAIAKLGGISVDYKQDITGDTKGNKTVPGVGAVFSKNGTSPDDMVTKLWEAGYITQADIDNPKDNGGVNHLYEMLRGELSGAKKRYQTTSSKALEDEYRDQEDSFQQQLEAEENERELRYSEILAEHGQEAADFARDHDESIRAYRDDLRLQIEAEEESWRAKQREEYDDEIAQAAAEADTAQGDEQLRQNTEQPGGRDGETPAAAQRQEQTEDVGFSLEQQTESTLRAKDKRDADTSLETKTQIDRERDFFGLEKPAGNVTGTGQATAATQGSMFGAPTRGERKASIDTAANEAATSPANDLPEPTQAQKEAGNYKKGKIKLHGLDISIENPSGSTRTGTNAKGKKWESTLAHHYGYIRRTTGADSEQIDAFIGPNPDSEKVFVVDQLNEQGHFDEHKVMLGFNTQVEAESGYLANYGKGWKIGPVTADTIDGFKAWLANGDTSLMYMDNSDGQAEEFYAPEEDADPIETENEEDWDATVENFPEPASTRRFDSELGTNYIDPADAKALLASWKAEAKRMGKEEDHSKEVVISLFDESGEISKPWREAGYTVMQYDIKLGDDLLEFFPMGDLIELNESDMHVVAVLAQPPCTCFSSSGARWWTERHDKHDRDMVEKMFGPKASRYFSKPLEYTKALVTMTDTLIGEVNQGKGPDVFLLENPVGRIATQTGLPKPTITFNPNNFGDPYTKKTQLWGKFNTDLPTANIKPTEGSLMHKLWSNAEKGKGQRSLTPEGFSYAFFMANKTASLGKSLSSIPITEEFEVEGTGRKATVTRTAKEALADIDAQLDGMKLLIACLKKSS